MLLAVCGVSAADQAYVVRRGDTLSDIAEKFRVAPGALAERNGLSRSGHVYVGQRLLIPIPPRKGAAASQKRGGKVLPAPVQGAINDARVRPGRWKYIVIHHSGMDAGTVSGMDRYHREVRHMENGLAYHFVIGNGNGMDPGMIAVCRRWTEQLDGGHLASEEQNKVALGICLVGNFDEAPPSAKQMESLRLLVEALLTRCKLPVKAVRTHQQINVVHTRCPGAKFPARSFIDSLRARGSKAARG
jgi:LysM repeat protein